MDSNHKPRSVQDAGSKHMSFQMWTDNFANILIFKHRHLHEYLHINYETNFRFCAKQDTERRTRISCLCSMPFTIVQCSGQFYPSRFLLLWTIDPQSTVLIQLLCSEELLQDISSDRFKAGQDRETGRGQSPINLHLIWFEQGVSHIVFPFVSKSRV